MIQQEEESFVTPPPPPLSVVDDFQLNTNFKSDTITGIITNTTTINDINIASNSIIPSLKDKDKEVELIKVFEEGQIQKQQQQHEFKEVTIHPLQSPLQIIEPVIPISTTTKNINNNDDEITQPPSLRSSINDPSALIEQNNRNFSLAGNLKSNRQGRLIEHFLVIGLSSDNKIDPNEKISHDGKVLYSYPPDYVCDPQVISFCFPDGIKLLQVHRRNSLTEIHAVLFKSLSQLEGSDTSFMFLVTGGEEMLYAACVLNTEPVDELPCFCPPKIFDDTLSSSSSSTSNNPREEYQSSKSKICIFAPRCYCVLSKFPFFKAHFDFIYSILGKERLNRINSILEKPPATTTANKPLSMTSASDLTKFKQQQQQQLTNTTIISKDAQLLPTITPPATTNQTQQTPIQLSPLSKSSMARLGVSKPLPPIPNHIAQQIITPNGISPLNVSPSDSPTIGSDSIETLSLISKNHQSIKQHHHTRSYSSPHHKLPQLSRGSSHLLNNSNKSGSGTTSLSTSTNSSASSSSIHDSLSAILESLNNSSNEDSTSPYPSSTDGGVGASGDNNMTRGSVGDVVSTFNTSSPIQFGDYSSASPLSNVQEDPSLNNSNNSNITNTSSTSSNRSLIDSSPLVLDHTTALIPEISNIDIGTVQEIEIRGLSNTTSPRKSKPLPKIPEKYLTTPTTNGIGSDGMAELISPITAPSHPPLLQISSPTMIANHPLSTSADNKVESNQSTTTSGSSFPPLPPTPAAKSKEGKQKELALEEIEIIKYYCTLMVPRETQKLVIQAPGENQTLTYEAGDDTLQIENWCLGGLMRTLSIRTILQTMTSILLEKFLIVTSKNIGLISNTIFAFIPLLRPYVYQGAFIPILPQSTLDVLHCPIPYVIGVTKIPNDMTEVLDNCIILDIDENKLIYGKNCQPLPNLPIDDKLETNLKLYHGQVWKENTRKYSLDYPFKTVQNDFKNINRFSTEWSTYHKFIIDSVSFYIDFNINFDFGKKENKEQLSKLFAPQHTQFMNQLLNTQLFTSHTELLFETISSLKKQHHSTTSTKEIQLNHYKSNKL